MKIALAIEQFDPLGGGAERSTHQIANELLARGHQVRVFAARSRNDDDLLFEVTKLFGREKLTAKRITQFSKWARSQINHSKAFDVSLSVTTSVPASVVQPRSGTLRETFNRNIAMRRSSLKRACKAWSLKLSPKRQALLRLEQQTFQAAELKCVAASSEYVVRQLREHYDVPSTLIDILPNAAVMPKVDVAQRKLWRTQMRKAFNIADDAVVYLFAAQNPKLKGIGPLLKSMAELKHTHPHAVLLLVGGVGLGHQKTATALGIRSQVRIVGQTNEMPALYCASDVTVLPTYYDPSSKVIIESLMMGVAAISTSYNGASDFIITKQHPPRGRVVEQPDDVQALTHAMRELADAKQRDKCVAAMAGLSDSLSMQQHVQKLETILQRVASVSC